MNASVCVMLIASVRAAAPEDVALEAPEVDWLVPSAHAASVLLGMRLSLSALWADAYSPVPTQETWRHLRDSYSRPPEFIAGRRLIESDGDPWWLNAVGHGLFGSELYQRSRACGADPLRALAFTALASAAWEYGVEAFHQRPSAIDLVWTPLAGALVGELRHRGWRALRGDSRAPARGLNRVLMFALDPFGETERAALHSGC